MRRLLLAALAAVTVVAPLTAMAQKPPTEIDPTDLKLDIAQMKGQTVKVTGLLQILGDMVLLKSGPMDMTAVWVDAKQLSRDDRKLLLTKCSIMCKATVIGKVGDSMFGGEGLNAIRLEDVAGFNANLF
jgi:hypothetical protein